MKNKREFITGVVLIVIGILGGISTNANPIPLIERIFRPIERGRSTFHYAGLIMLVVYYMGFKKLLQSIGKQFEKEKSKILLLVGVMFFMGFVGSTYNSMEKTYKSFQEDLRAVYVDVDQSTLRFKGRDDGIIQGTAMLVAENMSNEDIEISIKIMIPEFLRDKILEEEVVVMGEGEKPMNFNIPAKTQERLFIDFYVHGQGEGQLGGAETRSFDFVLFDEEREIEFKTRYPF